MLYKSIVNARVSEGDLGGVVAIVLVKTGVDIEVVEGRGELSIYDSSIPCRITKWYLGGMRGIFSTRCVARVGNAIRRLINAIYYEDTHFVHPIFIPRPAPFQGTLAPSLPLLSQPDTSNVNQR